MGFYVKWKVISIANGEFENEKREDGNIDMMCENIIKSLIFQDPGTFL